MDPEECHFGVKMQILQYSKIGEFFQGPVEETAGKN